MAVIEKIQEQQEDTMQDEEIFQYRNIRKGDIREDDKMSQGSRRSKDSKNSKNSKGSKTSKTSKGSRGSRISKQSKVSRQSNKDRKSRSEEQNKEDEEQFRLSTEALLKTGLGMRKRVESVPQDENV